MQSLVSSFLSFLMLFFFFGIQGLAFGQVPQERPVFYADIQGGVNIPIGPGLGSTFQEQTSNTQLAGSFSNSNGSFSNGNQGVSGRVGLNVGFWANDNPANFWSHFGGNINFSYNALGFQSTGGSFTENVTTTQTYTKVIPPPFPDTIQYTVQTTATTRGSASLSSSGNLFSLAFLANYRQGLLPNDQVPYGRLQIYGGVGPALFINSQQFSFSGGLSNHSFPSQTNVSPGLMVQVGTRYFFTKRIYANMSFDYRYFQSSFGLSTGNFSSHLNYGNNLLGVNFGAGLQF